MVAPSGGTESAGTLRRLNAPRRIDVRTDDDGAPVALRLGAGGQARWDRPSGLSGPEASLVITEILDRWRTDDRWWTGTPTSRLYYAVLLEDGRPLTMFHDLIADAWYEQRWR